MTKEELLSFIDGDGKDMFSEITSERGLSKIDKTSIEKYFTTVEGKSLLFSKCDIEHNRRMKKYKEDGGFAKDFDEEFKKRNPQMTEEQKKLMDMETELNGYKDREKISNNYKELKPLIEQYKMSEKMAKKLIGGDLENSKTELEEFGKEYLQYVTTQIENGVTERLGSSTKPLPTSGEQKIKSSVFDDILSGKKS